MCYQFILIQSRNFQVALYKFMLCLQSPTCLYISSIDNWSEPYPSSPPSTARHLLPSFYHRSTTCMTCTIVECTVNKLLMMDRGNCLKHVEFHAKINL